MTTLAAAPPQRPAVRRPSRLYLVWLVLAGLVCVAIAAFAAGAYVTLDISQSRPPVRGAWHYGLLVTHIFTGFIAVVTGIAQFVPWLRDRHPRVHRWTGRVYFAAVFPSAVFAFVVAWLSLAGLASLAPLSLLAVLWFVSAVQGLRYARARNFRAHRVWMIRNYAITAAAVTGRLWALALMAVFPNDLVSFTTANWLGLAINMLVAEWWIQRRYHRL
ncbi:membrane protein [Lentzea sp. NBRC 105346]|uniref:DUF2306 domain-containing protein n=1 Tax=Lentzea sp. NBRC 105346 TaxID=3032205 RepID=UPI0024A2BAF9|nr:DUF2306 domain-containing protein [Lentzea sp. NBRC 105346]GLZ28909.1 membrane protein [Lentzea sp. NBRC 105346]